MLASDVNAFYSVFPDLFGKLGGKLQAVCQKRPDLLHMVHDGKSVYIESVKSSPATSKAPAQANDANVQLLVDFVRESGGRMLASDVTKFYNRYPSLAGVFTGRLIQICQKHPSLLRMRSLGVGSEYLETVGDSPLEASDIIAPSSSKPTPASGSQPASSSTSSHQPIDFDSAVVRLVDWIRSHGGQIYASNVSQFYSDNPDLTGCFLGKIKSLCETHPRALELVGPTNDGGKIVLKVKEQASASSSSSADAAQRKTTLKVANVDVTGDAARVKGALVLLEDTIAVDIKADARGLSLVLINCGSKLESCLLIDVAPPLGVGILRESGLAQVLENPSVIKVMYDCSQAANHLARAGIRLSSVWDTKSACAVLVGNNHSFDQVLETYEIESSPGFGNEPEVERGKNLDCFARPVSEELVLIGAYYIAHLVPLYERMRQDAFSTDMLERCFQASALIIKTQLLSADEVAKKATVGPPPPRSLSGTDMLAALDKAGLPPNACYHFHIAGHCRPHPKYGPCKFLHDFVSESDAKER